MDRSRSSISLISHDECRSRRSFKMMHNLLETLNQNPFFSGGLSLMVLGASAALLRKVPGQLWALIQRRLSITVEVPDRDPAFRWLQVWLAVQPYAGRARDLSLATTWVPADAESDTAVVFDPDDSRSNWSFVAGQVSALAGTWHALDALSQPALDLAPKPARPAKRQCPHVSGEPVAASSGRHARTHRAAPEPMHESWRALGRPGSAS